MVSGEGEDFRQQELQVLSGNDHNICGVWIQRKCIVTCFCLVPSIRRMKWRLRSFDGNYKDQGTYMLATFEAVAGILVITQIKVVTCSQLVDPPPKWAWGVALRRKPHSVQIVHDMTRQTRMMMVMMMIMGFWCRWWKRWFWWWWW